MRWPVPILVLLLAVLPACGPRQPPPDLAFEAAVPAEGPAEVARRAAEAPEVRLEAAAPGGPGLDLGGRLGPGSSAARVKEVLGEAERVLSREEEKKAWEAFGYHTAREIPFFLGFDEVWEYSPRSNRSLLPVWKVYLKAGRAVLINLSSYVYPEARGSLSPDFGSTRQEIERALGSGSFSYTDAGGTQNLCYHRRGLDVLLTFPPRAPGAASQPARATNFLLYRPLSGAQSRRLVELFAEP